MKILVDSLPNHPRDCPFSSWDAKAGYVCQLRPYIYEASGKPRCVCKDVRLCDRLIPISNNIE